MLLINVTNLTFGYEGSYDNVFENASFQLDTDWKLGFTGRNGRGKTTFLNLLLGKYSYSGTIHSSVEFEYCPYEVPDMSEYTIEVMRNVCPMADDFPRQQNARPSSRTRWRPVKLAQPISVLKSTGDMWDTSPQR